MEKLFCYAITYDYFTSLKSLYIYRFTQAH